MSNETPIESRENGNPEWADLTAYESWTVLGSHNLLGTSPTSPIQPALQDTQDGTDPIPPTNLLTLSIGAAMVGNGDRNDS